MSSAPLFEDPRISEIIARDPEIRAMVTRAQKNKLAAGLALLVVLALISLMSFFR